MSFLKRAASVSHSSWWWNPTIDQLLAIKNADFDNIVAWLDHNIDKKQTQQNNNNNVNTSNNNNNSGFTPGSSETRISLTIPQIHHCFLNAKEKSATGHPPTHLVIKLLYELELQFIKLFNVDSKGSSQRFKQYNSFIPTNENTSMLHWSMCSIAKNRIKDRFESVFQVDDTGAFKQIFSVYDHLFGKDSDQRDHLATQLNSSIKDNPSLKWEIITYYYDIVSHFYVFIELMYHVLRVKMPSSSTVTSPTKNNSSSSSNGNGKSGGSNSDSIAKKLKTYRANIESQMNGKSFSSHYLRVDESKDNYLLFDHTGNITMMHSGLNSKKPITKQLEKITVRNRLYDDTKEISKYLLLIADDLDLYFQSPFIPISGVLRLYDVLLETKSIKMSLCKYCQQASHSTTSCSYCADNICQACQRRDQCVKCYYLNHSIGVKVQIHDGNNKNKGPIAMININSSKFIDFTTQIFHVFKIDKGMKIECTLHGHSTVLLNNDINMHLALRSGDSNTCKLVKVRVTDPPIKGLRLKMSDLKELEPIGEGGCASVFAVEAPNTPELANVPMVLKKFKIPYHGDDSGVRNINKTIDKSVYKFKREASFLSQVESEYIIKMFAFVEGNDDTSNEFGIILERAPLGSLSNKRYSDWELILLILLDICNALIVVHERGFIHQDLKPDNVLLFSESVTAPVRCKLSDFGISTKQKKMHNLGHTGISRTAGYNAPEHGSHGNYNELVDIFSFGVMMFEIITGEYFLNYFGNPNFHWSDIDMHASVKKLNESMTNTTPEKRPQSMTEIKVSLERILQDYRTQKWEMKDYSNLHTKKK